MSAMRSKAVDTLKSIITAVPLTEQAVTAISVAMICTAAIDSYMEEIKKRDEKIAELEADYEILKDTGGYGL